METHARLSRNFHQLRNRLFEFHGRQARPAPAWFNLLKTLLQSLGMWTVFLVLGPLLVLQIEAATSLDRFHFAFPGQRELGIFVFIAGWFSAWLSAYFLVVYGEGTPLPVDSPRKLVIVGPYRFVRNPMALTSLIQGSGIGIIAGSPFVLLYVVAGGLVWNFVARPWEEVDLANKFGDDYIHYQQHIRCWTPHLRPYISPSEYTERGNN